MNVASLNWMQMEARLRRDDRAVVPIGSTEQHAYLSLATDSILAERVAREAAEPLEVPVFPVMPYGITPRFMAYPGSITLRVETLCAVVRDVLDSLHAHGVRRVLVVNGHGGNTPAQSAVSDWLIAHPDARVRWHDWWHAPQVIARVREIDALASHASWMENFPWTRLEGVAMPDEVKPDLPFSQWTHLPPREIRARLGDGNFAGRYQRDDDEMWSIWRVAVAETRERLEGDWG